MSGCRGFVALAATITATHSTLGIECSVYTFDEHGEAIRAWADARDAGELVLGSPSSSSSGASTGATLVHFDSHADMGLPPYFEGADGMSGLELGQRVGIATFIPPAVLAGLVSRIIWVMPAWGTELEYGTDYEYFVAEDREGGAFRTNAPFAHEMTDPSEAGSFDNVRFYNVSVVPFTREALDGLEIAEPFILDVDLDVFATENPACVLLREKFGLDLPSVERFVECSCAVDAECNAEIVKGLKVPKEFARQVVSLSQQDFYSFDEGICRSPVHYSSEEEILASITLLFDWVESLKDAGLKPGVVTVSESADGFLPPHALESVKSVASRLSESLRCRSPLWMECSNCVQLLARNDLDVGVDMYYLDTHDEEKMFLAHMLSDSDYRQQSTYGLSFVFVSLNGHRYQFKTAYGEQKQTVSISTLQKWPKKFAVDLEVVNDLDVDIDILWVDATGGGDWFSSPVEFVDRMPAGDESELSTFAGHHFILETSDRSRKLHLPVPLGDSEYSFRISQLDDCTEELSVTVDLFVHNDLDVVVDFFWEDNDEASDEPSLEKLGSIPPGEKINLSASAGHTFHFRNEEVGYRLKFHTTFEKKTQSVFLSESLLLSELGQTFIKSNSDSEL